MDRLQKTWLGRISNSVEKLWSMERHWQASAYLLTNHLSNIVWQIWTCEKLKHSSFLFCLFPDLLPSPLLSQVLSPESTFGTELATCISAGAITSNASSSKREELGGGWAPWDWGGPGMQPLGHIQAFILRPHSPSWGCAASSALLLLNSILSFKVPPTSGETENRPEKKE